MRVIQLKPHVDPIIQLCESLVSLAQGIALIAEDATNLEISGSSRTEIAQALSGAARAVHLAAKAVEAAFDEGPANTSRS